MQIDFSHLRLSTYAPTPSQLPQRVSCRRRRHYKCGNNTWAIRAGVRMDWSAFLHGGTEETHKERVACTLEVQVCLWLEACARQESERRSDGECACVCTESIITHAAPWRNLGAMRLGSSTCPQHKSSTCPSRRQPAPFFCSIILPHIKVIHLESLLRF